MIADTMDANHDHRISRAEYLAYWRPRAGDAAGTSMLSEFDKYDLNHDGFLDLPQEAAPALQDAVFVAGFTCDKNHDEVFSGADELLCFIDFARSVHPESSTARTTAPSAQATKPAYLSEMPSVERVMREVHGKDALDTELRQLGALHQLSRMIPIMAMGLEHRPASRLTPDELRVKAGYDNAFTPLAAKVTYPVYLNSGYGLSAELVETLLKQFFSPQVRELYHKFNPSELAELAYERRPPVAEPPRPAPRPQINIYNAPGGNSGTAAGSQSAQGDMASSLRNIVKGLNRMRPGGAPHPGLQMIGTFKGGGITVAFRLRQSVGIACGELLPLNQPYTVQQNGGRTMIRIENQPEPILLQLHSDGNLSGQGSTIVSGQVEVGTHRVWEQNPGAPGPSYGYWRTEPTYGPKKARCVIGQMAPTGVTSTVGGDVDRAMSQFGLQGNRFKVSPGLRLNGVFVGPSGASIGFDEDSATVRCGGGGMERAYAIQATDGGVLVNIDGGVVLILGTDGRLTPSGGSTGCNLGILSPTAG